MGEPVEGEAAGGDGPEEFDAGGLREIEEQMENSGGERGDENWERWSLFFSGSELEEEKWERDEQGEEQSREQGMTMARVGVIVIFGLG